MKKDRRKCGPFSEEECIRLIRQEIIEPSDFIWNTYMENWLRLWIRSIRSTFPAISKRKTAVHAHSCLF